MKVALPAAILLAALALAFSIWTWTPSDDASVPCPALPDYSWSDIRDILLQEQALDAKIKRQQHFYNTMRESSRAVLHGSRTLREVADELILVAEENYPFYLEAVNRRFPGESLQVQISRAVLELFEFGRDADTLTPEELDRAAELRLAFDNGTCD